MSLKPLTRTLLTLATVAVAIVLVAALWHAYVLAPWTRDARVSAHVVRIAPEGRAPSSTSRWSTTSASRNDVLYRIDPRFALAVEQAEAQVAATASRCARSATKRSSAPASTISCRARTHPALEPRGVDRAGRAPAGAGRARRREARPRTHDAALAGRRHAAALVMATTRSRASPVFRCSTHTTSGSPAISGNQAAPHRNGCARNDPADGLRSAAERARDEHRPRHRGRTATRSTNSPAGRQSDLQLGAARAAHSGAHRDRPVPAGVLLAAGMTCSVESANAGATARARPLRVVATRGCEGGDDAMPASSTASDTLRAHLHRGLHVRAAHATVGPDYAAPPVHPSSWIASRDTVAADPAQLQDWWHTFGDAQLDALVAQAIALNRISRSRASGCCRRAPNATRSRAASARP